MKNKYKHQEKCEIGDVIYPHYNGTAGFFKESIWNVVTELDEEGYWKKLHCWYSNETAELHSMILNLHKTREK